MFTFTTHDRSSTAGRLIVGALYVVFKQMAEEESVFSFVKEGEYELILGNSLGNKKKEQEIAFHTVRCKYSKTFVVAVV